MLCISAGGQSEYSTDAFFRRLYGNPARMSLYTDGVQGLEKVIPDTPKSQTPVHLRDYQVMADTQHVLRRGEKDVGIMKDGSTAAKQ
jgi:hypothetical protein